MESTNERNRIIQGVHAVEGVDLVSQLLQLLCLQPHLHPAALVLNPYALGHAAVSEPDGVSAAQQEPRALADQLVLILVGGLALEVPVLVDNEVQGVDGHGAAEADEDVADHLIDLDGPLDGDDATAVDGVDDVEVEEVELLLDLVEGGLDEGGVREHEMLVEGGVEFDVELEGLARQEAASQVLQLGEGASDLVDAVGDRLDSLPAALDLLFEAVAPRVRFELRLGHAVLAAGALHHQVFALRQMRRVVLQYHLLLASRALLH